MRSIQRTLRPPRGDGLLRDVSAVAAAVGMVGLSFGAMATAAGIPPQLSIGMSLLIFAGGSQFLAVGICGAGGGIGTAVLAALLLNARHLPFGLAVSDVFDRGWVTRLLGSHIMIDESVAFALAQTGPERRRKAYWYCGLGVFICWNLGGAVGALLGQAAGDPARLGLDAAFPAGLLALLMPALAEPAARRVAVAGAVIAVAATPMVRPGAGILLALLALVFALPLPTRFTTGARQRDLP